MYYCSPPRGCPEPPSPMGSGPVTLTSSILLVFICSQTTLCEKLIYFIHTLLNMGDDGGHWEAVSTVDAIKEAIANAD